MSVDAVSVLLVHFVRAETDRRLHLGRQHKGSIEAMIAGHKSAWLRELIREIGGDEAAKRADDLRRGRS